MNWTKHNLLVGMLTRLDNITQEYALSNVVYSCMYSLYISTHFHLNFSYSLGVGSLLVSFLYSLKQSRHLLLQFLHQEIARPVWAKGMSASFFSRRFRYNVISWESVCTKASPQPLNALVVFSWCRNQWRSPMIKIIWNWNLGYVSISHQW